MKICIKGDFFYHIFVKKILFFFKHISKLTPYEIPQRCTCTCQISLQKSNKYRNYCTVERLHGFLTDKILRRFAKKHLVRHSRQVLIKVSLCLYSQVAVSVTRKRKKKEKRMNINHSQNIF